MTEPLFPATPLAEAVAALRRDLVADGGPRISTMRNYRFAILPYRPSDEFTMRKLIRRLVDELRAQGWSVLQISLQKLLLERLRSLGPDVVDKLSASEKRLYQRDPERALAHLRDRIAPHVEGTDGLAADVIRTIHEFTTENADRIDRSLVLVGRAGALYPFFRTSALLKHLDGNTHNVPVVLLYPGKRDGATGLSFMEELPPDRDYRPRIYP